MNVVAPSLKSLAERVLSRTPHVHDAHLDDRLNDIDVAAVKLTRTTIGDVWLIRDADTLAEEPSILGQGLPVILFSEITKFRALSPTDARIVATTLRTFPGSRILH